MKRGNEEASDGANEEQISADLEGSNDEQSVKNNAQAEDSSDSSKSSVKRMRSEDQEVRLLIPSKMAGAIIGKGGHNIQKLRTEYQAQVNIGDCTGPERVLTIAADMETVTKVVKDVMKHLDRAGDNEYELRILIHLSLAGCVIGRGGSKIKEIKDEIGCRLKIFSNIPPQSTDRIAQVIGSEEQCLKTLNEIIKLVKGTPIKGPVHNYDPHNYDDMYADEYGGYGVGGGGGAGGSSGAGVFRNGAGSRGNGSGGATGSGYDRRGERFDDRGRSSRGGGGGGGYERGNDRTNRGAVGAVVGGGVTGGGGGGAAGGMRDRDYINPWANPINGGNMGGNFGNSTGIGLGSLGSLNLGGAGGNLGNGNLPNFGAGNNGAMDNKTSTQVTIPKDLAGAIIGKGGGRIRRIRNESNAFIQIDEALPGSNDRIITITGTPKEIQAAQYMLQQSVRENLSGTGSGFNRN
ncbi:heterogeneous nuclear ribonucleoprotein K isoform X1 [Anopheles bellator]|uniref:heterogeneous nuclear ribonucleoprotein K isoform X1 n=1 Tax=Anopheles bellator TaxID=139047 RepID=UPI0026484F0E|nr:heterogeneous nuclear ribonucleoprotein K isoform X1 [Anopheles bellator]XP_058054718.1 heterogeneous nuclear ribonucleoprotein K isoform X1 [Anopheles bellator]